MQSAPPLYQRTCTALRLLAMAFFTTAPASAAVMELPEKPNVVVILVDDLGYADLGCQGSEEVRTPRIDSLAENGLRFTDGYSSAAQCGPARAGLMTGRYQQRFGYDINLGPKRTASGEYGLPITEPSIAERMRGAGYATAAIGKWALGGGAIHHPNERGFDFFYGFIGGSRSHMPRNDHIKFNVLLRNHEPVEETDWSSDIYGQEAAGFIRRHADEPFFAYVAFTAPHWPMEAKEEDLAHFTEVEDLHRRTFLGMMAGLDRGVGLILDAIEESGIEERTLVFFLSDNGGASGLTHPRTAPDAPFQYGVNTSRNDPLRATKGWPYEGGIRVPFLACWPGVIEPGRTSATPVISLDIAATAAALAGARTGGNYPLDGADLTPLLTGASDELGARNLYWRAKGRRAIRSGPWKLVTIGKTGPELYNLETDISESVNLAESEPERLASLHRKLRAWLRTMDRPRW